MNKADNTKQNETKERKKGRECLHADKVELMFLTGGNTTQQSQYCANKNVFFFLLTNDDDDDNDDL